MILFVNACVRGRSRTKRLADALLEKLNEKVEEIRLSDVNFPVVDEKFLVERDALIASGSFLDRTFDLARQFAAADTVVIAAPLWDLSFPSALKRYLEQICVVGVTFKYGEDGVPQGLCRAKKLYYVTTAGGKFFPEEFGFGYVKALCQNFFGIDDVRLIKAVGLDIYGADQEAILKDEITRLKVES